MWIVGTLTTGAVAGWTCGLLLRPRAPWRDHALLLAAIALSAAAVLWIAGAAAALAFVTSTAVFRILHAICREAFREARSS